MTGLRTEYPFTLPKGFIDASGVLHRHGTMRLATARDEIEPLRDRRIAGPDDPYLTVLVLARVITELGSVSQVTPEDVEEFFAADLAFLQDLYGIVNFGDPADVEALQSSVLPVESVETTTNDDEAEADSDGDDHGGDDHGADGAETNGDAAGHSADSSAQPSVPARRRGKIEEVGRTTTG